MQVNAILGVDISKLKFDSCLLLDNTKRYKVLHNNQEGFKKLVNWRNHYGADLVHICLETTGYSSEGIVNFMYKLGHNISVINQIQIKAFGKSEMLRNKNQMQQRLLVLHCQ